MSALAFQTALARLIVEPDFRDAVRAEGPAALPGPLTALESSRLVTIASDRGIDMNRTLHKGFRLGKLRALLPLTCSLLPPARLAREVAAFWRANPPASFSFLPEALEFCAFLERRSLRSVYLAEVLAYERATLELERARVGPAPPQSVRFRHDPVRLLGTLAAGRRPRAVPPRTCLLLGSKEGDEPAHWTLVDAESSPRRYDRGQAAATASGTKGLTR
ncbi:MAG: hypothetical protein K8R60_15960 [Burkholderiales bacterium]|nr:hypothetical protein [Burkholderiales bacterium]